MATWTWCAMPGAARATALAVETNAFGDGYTHRSTRGLNPARASWTLNFPFVGFTALDAMDAFLRANAVGGFYWRPPDGAADVFVTTDEWQAMIADQSQASGIVGTLQTTFVQSFNPQP